MPRVLSVVGNFSLIEPLDLMERMRIHATEIPKYHLQPTDKCTVLLRGLEV